MKLNNWLSNFLLLGFFIFLSSPSFAIVDQLIITRVCDTGDGCSAELIEVFNPTSRPLTLTGLEEGSNGCRWGKSCGDTESVKIGSGGFLLFADGVSSYNGVSVDSGVTLSLGNNSEGVRITQANGDTDAVGWDASGVEGDVTSGFFESEVIDHTSNVDAVRDTDPGGFPIDTNNNSSDFTETDKDVTPKTGYSTKAPNKALVITRMSNQTKEYVEVFNPTNKVLKLISFQEESGADSNNVNRKLSPNEYLLICEAGVSAVKGIECDGSMSSNLANSGEGFRIKAQRKGGGTDTDAVGDAGANTGFQEGGGISISGDMHVLRHVDMDSIPIDTDENSADFQELVDLADMGTPKSGFKASSLISKLTSSGVVSDTRPSDSSIAVPASRSETVPSFTQVTFDDTAFEDNTTTGSLKNRADSDGTDANYKVSTPLLQTGLDTLTLHIWTNQFPAGLLLGLRTDSGALNKQALPPGISSGGESFEAFVRSTILVEFFNSNSNVLGDTVSTTDIEDTYSYTLVYDLSESTTNLFEQAGFDTSFGSSDFKYYFADSFSEVWQRDNGSTVTVDTGANGGMTLRVIGLSRDLPGGIGGSSASKNVSDNDSCLIEQTGLLSESHLIYIRKFRDYIFSLKAGRLLTKTYYSIVI